MVEAHCIGHIEAIFRYPIKSMAGESLPAAQLGWHGLEDDRRFALRRLDDDSAFPWLTASKLPDLLRFSPFRRDASATDGLPTHVRTPDGRELPLGGDELAAEIARLHGKPVQLMQLKHGIFDEASISVITTATVGEIARLAAQPPDVRRFRPNILIASLRSVPFEEDQWLGGVLIFGEAEQHRPGAGEGSPVPQWIGCPPGGQLW